MPNIALLLKDEITRIARRETRAHVKALTKTLRASRSEIAALKRRAMALERELRNLQRSDRRSRQEASASGPPGKQPRFSAKSLASQRNRLQLSAQDCGLLVGASAQSIYNWEQGKARPHAKHIVAIAALRSLGKRQAAAALESLGRAA
jgi:DNA-binding transcriptional regulator YiaG